MSSRRNKQVLIKIIAHIEHTLVYCADISFDRFTDDRMLQEACVFNILQIGELAHNGLDSEFTGNHPEIPWHQIYGLRNRIVHDYDGIQMRIVWETISNDFEPLKAALSSILESME